MKKSYSNNTKDIQQFKHAKNMNTHIELICMRRMLEKTKDLLLPICFIRVFSCFFVDCFLVKKDEFC